MQNEGFKEIEKKLKTQYNKAARIYVSGIISLATLAVGIVLCVQWFGWKLLLVLLLFKIGWEIKK